MIHSRRRDRIIKCLAIILLGVVFHNELISYVWQYSKWPEVKCGETKEFHKVLIIADPQILGEKTESWIARWDSDRFLSKTFTLAVRHISPDYIVFLGDLMDEGSVATSDQYIRYYKRFRKIYALDRFFTNTTIFIPGDNDIGGEDEEITSLKVTRYYKHFHQTEHIKAGTIEFIKVNKLLKTYPVVSNSQNSNGIKVMLSHVPLMGASSYFSGQAISLHRPDIIFSAHEHKSLHFVGDPNSGQKTFIEQLLGNTYASDAPTWRYEIGNGVVNEIVVPTCSYRMGVEDIGFGMALIDKKGETVCYSILWLPQRLMHLIAYAASLPFLVIIIIYIWRSNRGIWNQPLYY